MRVEAEPADGWLPRGIAAQPDAPESAAVRHHQLAAVVLREPRHPDEHTVGTIGVRSYITTLRLDEGFPAESPWWPHTSIVSTHGRSGGTLPGSSQSDPGAECHNVRPDPHSGREEV